MTTHVVWLLNCVQAQVPTIRSYITPINGTRSVLVVIASSICIAKVFHEEYTLDHPAIIVQGYTGTLLLQLPSSLRVTISGGVGPTQGLLLFPRGQTRHSSGFGSQYYHRKDLVPESLTPFTLNPKQRSPKPEALNSKPYTLSPKPETYWGSPTDGLC